VRLLIFGNHSTGDGYPRLAVLAEGLRERGVEVLEARVPLLEGEGERSKAVASPLGFLRAAAGAAAMKGRLARAYEAAPAHDAVLVGYPGHSAVRVARRANRDGRRPLVLDAFLSLHDTAVHDRALAPEGSLRARALRHLDATSCAAADLVMVDTEEHADLFHASCGVPRERLLAVPVGALPFPASLPGPPEPPPPARPLRVLFFGTYVPLQGTEVIVEAAARARGVEVLMVGRGQDLEAARERAAALALGPPRLERVEAFLPRRELDRRIAAADVCLGIFGVTAKAARVVPCKVHDALAAGKPLVTGDSPASRGLLRDGEDALLVPPGDPGALAEALERLRGDAGLRARLAAGARETWARRLAPVKVVEGLVEALERECRRGSPTPPGPPRTA